MLSFMWESCWCRAMLFNRMGGNRTFAALCIEACCAGQSVNSQHAPKWQLSISGDRGVVKSQRTETSFLKI